LLVAGEIDAQHEASSNHILEELGIEAHRIPSMHRSIHPWNDWKAYREICKLIRTFRPDIVHTHAAKAGTIGRLAAAHCGVPYVFHTFHGHVFHSYFNSLKTRSYIAIERYLARKSSCIVAVSDRQKDELANEYRIAPSDKIHVVYNGFHLEKFWTDTDAKRGLFHSSYNVKPDELTIGIIGRLVPIKNHLLFLKAIEKVFAQLNLPLKVFIIGDGEERSMLENYIQTNKLNDRSNQQIIFTSWIKNVDVALAGLDLLVLTSRNEGTPVTLIEAQATGIPVVSTRVGGVEDIIQDTKTGFLVESDDVDAIAEKISLLLKDQGLRRSMGEEGRAFVRDRFQYDHLATRMSALYRSYLGR